MQLGVSPIPKAPNTFWMLLSCSTALLILIMATAEHQLHNFRPSTGERSTVAWDFQIYYTAGKVARQAGDRQLYYPTGGAEKPSARNLLDNVAPETPWGQTARSSGFKTTGQFMAPPFTAILMEPLALLPPRLSLFLWRMASAAMLIVALYFILQMSVEMGSLPIALMASAGVALSFFPFTETLFQGQVDALLL